MHCSPLKSLLLLLLVAPAASAVAPSFQARAAAGNPTPREKPFFAVGLRAWTGHGMDFAAATAGERTATGYTVHLLIKDGFNLHTPVKLSNRDFVGLLVAVAQHATPDGKPGFSITANQSNDLPVNLYANNLPILDLKNKIPGDSIINAHLTAAYVP